MNFLNSGTMWGLLALAGLPFLIHWLSRRFPRKFIFSSLDDIRRTLAGRSRLRTWRHFVYLLLRSLALVALVLAFLKPVTGLHESSDPVGQRHIILLIDQSLSMAHHDGNMSTYRRARVEARKILDTLDPLDKVNVILVGRSPRPAFGQFSHNTAAALKFIDDSEPLATEADFQAAMLLVSQLAEQSPGTLEIFFLSDFQRKNWADVHLTGLPMDARLYFIPATDDEARTNQAILEASLAEHEPSAGQEFSITVRIGNYSNNNYNGKLEALLSESLAVDASVSLPPWGETDLRLDLPGLPAGLHGIQLQLSPDQLALDNSRYLTINVRESEEVLILTDSPSTDTESSPPARFLRAAVNPFPDGQGGYRVRELDGPALNSSVLSGSSKLLASRTPELSIEQAAALAGFLRAGGGMLLFLDGDHDRSNLAKLSEHLDYPLPLELTKRLQAEHLPGGAMRIAQGDFRSPFLRLFRGERRRNLGFLEFYELYHATPTGEGRILLRYADGTPALAEAQVGLGTLLLCNFSVSEFSSNLARQRLFPGWIHDLLANLSPTGSADIAYLAGDTIYTDAWASEALGRAILGPEDQEITSQSEMRGERLQLNFIAPSPGLYRLPGKGGRLLRAFAVNSPSRESDLRTLDPDILLARAPDSQNATRIGANESYQDLRKGHPAYHWFVLAALAFLGIEALLHGFLNPKAKPARAS